jgi:hypothetical protein
MEDRSLSFLPWAHSYGQTVELHSGLAVGSSTGIAAGAPGDAVELLANIQEVKPTVTSSSLNMRACNSVTNHIIIYDVVGAVFSANFIQASVRWSQQKD